MGRERERERERERGREEEEERRERNRRRRKGERGEGKGRDGRRDECDGRRTAELVSILSVGIQIIAMQAQHNNYSLVNDLNTFLYTGIF